MPEFHAEPYVYLPAVTDRSALVAWGAFYFRVTSKGRWKLVDDSDLKYVHPPRCDSIGAASAPYGPALVEAYDRGGTRVACAKTAGSNHCWLTGLTPDTEYTYRVFVKDEEWAQGERWDWSPAEQGLVQKGGRYDNRFRTHPASSAPPAPMAFGVIGDFGVGMKKETATRRQQAIADALTLAVDAEGIRLLLTTGDNIYAGRKLFGIPIGETGDEDDDWFFTYFQPYRYIINRVPVYPSIGNHDANETEECDDRAQVEDNFYICERISGEEGRGRASFGPGLFYTIRYGADIEFTCIDTSKEGFFKGHRLFEYPKHWEFLERAFPASPAPRPQWRIPFAHHPPYSAGPQHYNTGSMRQLLPLFERAGVRAMFSGHEHNFQHAHADGIDYFVSGAAGKFRGGTPDRFAQARTRSWSAQCHFLLGRINGDRLTVRAIGERSPAGQLTDIPRWTPAGEQVSGAIVVEGSGRG